MLGNNSDQAVAVRSLWFAFLFVVGNLFSGVFIGQAAADIGFARSNAPASSSVIFQKNGLAFEANLFAAVSIQSAVADIGVDTHYTLTAVNVRNNPSTGSRIIGKLGVGEKITDFQKIGDWIQFNHYYKPANSRTPRQIVLFHFQPQCFYRNAQHDGRFRDVPVREFQNVADVLALETPHGIPEVERVRNSLTGVSIVFRWAWPTGFKEH